MFSKTFCISAAGIHRPLLNASLTTKNGALLFDVFSVYKQS